MTAMTRRMFLMGGISFFPYLYLETLSVAVRRYRVPVRALPAAFEGFTILHLSDLHDKEFGSGGSALLALLSGERIDLVALTGDLVVGDRPRLTPALDLIAGFRKASDRPIYSVSGNHEWLLERAPEFNDRLREAGAQVLQNSSAALERGQERLWIAGVDDPITRRARVSQALSATDNRSPLLLLAHSPHPYPLAVKHGVDLMLAGHTHGGQVRLPFVGASYVPSMGFFPRYDYGLYNSGPTTMIVSGGLGESMLPIRFNMPPEISLITLASAQPEQSSP